jgi:predicted membrane channel-forming protein YqfA (hemolysin III family)
MVDGDGERGRKFHLWGWILFVICAGFFIAQSIRDSDGLGLAASIIFLAGCLVFIYPLVRGGKG